MDFPPFEPHPLLRPGFAMSAVASLKRRGLENLRREQEQRILEVDDETSVVVHLDRPRERPTDALVLVHGLSASSEAGYVLGAAAKARARGLLVARLNVRNCGETEELTSKVYNGGWTAEVERVAQELVTTEGVERVHLAGFSMGGNHVLKLAAEWGDSPPDWLGSVGTVSPCVDFAAAADRMNTGLFQRLVQWRLIAALKRILRRRHAADGGAFSLDGLDQVRTIRQFDERFTAPLSGYRDADEYYADASSLARLPRIEVPTLILAAKDDPLIPFASFARSEIRDNPHIRLVAPRHGGHVAFLGRAPAQVKDWEDHDRFWAENRLVQFAVMNQGVD